MECRLLVGSYVYEIFQGKNTGFLLQGILSQKSHLGLLSICPSSSYFSKWESWKRQIRWGQSKNQIHMYNQECLFFFFFRFFVVVGMGLQLFSPHLLGAKSCKLSLRNWMKGCDYFWDTSGKTSIEILGVIVHSLNDVRLLCKMFASHDTLCEVLLSWQMQTSRDFSGNLCSVPHITL